MSILFVADIHLSIKKPVITNLFMHFLQYRAIQAKALYILGDLFDLWIGDNYHNQLHNEIALALKKLNTRGINCYFIHGNRDFLLGQRYAAACGMTLLQNKHVILELTGKRVVILHGDTLCCTDVTYQLFRIFVRHYLLQRFFSLLPLSIRLRIANNIRAKSIYANTYKSASIMEVNQQAVMTLLAENNAIIMIHGHTHHPAIHRIISTTGDECQRVVLGAWHQHKGSFIEISTTGSITLKEYRMILSAPPS